MTIESTPDSKAVSVNRHELRIMMKRVKALIDFCDLLQRNAHNTEWDYDRLILVVRLVGWMAEELRQDIRLLYSDDDIPF